MKYEKGDWVRYRHHEGWTATGIIINVRPDEVYVIGDSEQDQNPNPVKESEIVKKIRK